MAKPLKLFIFVVLTIVGLMSDTATGNCEATKNIGHTNGANIYEMFMSPLSCIALLTDEFKNCDKTEHVRLKNQLKDQKIEVLEHRVKLAELNLKYEKVLKIAADQDAVISGLRKSDQNKESEMKRLISTFNQSPINTQDLIISDYCEFSSGIHKISLPDGDSFSIPYSKHIDGNCWMIIQRRMDDYVDFYKNWKDYREGFGNLRGSFFIGLDKLYRMLSSEPHELYIEIADFDNVTRYAHYDNFVIENETEKYQLKSLGTFSGNTRDSMRIQEGQRFSTFDNDNDSWSGMNCADFRQGGWWYNTCADSNLNGRYFTEEGYKPAGIYWDDQEWHRNYYNQKLVQMLIKPKQ